MTQEQPPRALIIDDNHGFSSAIADTLSGGYGFMVAQYERPRNLDHYITNILTYLAVAIIFVHANQPTDEAELNQIVAQGIPLVVLRRHVGGATQQLEPMYDRLEALSGRIIVVERMDLDHVGMAAVLNELNML